MSSLTHEPWRELPQGLARLIEPELPGLRDEILAVIAAEVPEYARPLEGNFGRGLRFGVEEALRQFARLVADPDGGRAQSRDVYRALGRGEMREGRSLDSLQAAYRVGARVSWRRLSQVGIRGGLDPLELCTLADAIFAYIDELSADSVEGYADAQQAAAGERDRRRRRVLAELLAEAPDPEALRRAAREADWQLPRTVALLACDTAMVDRVARRFGIDAIAGLVDELGCVAIPDPAGPGRRAQLERATDGAAAALGPERSPADARLSWRRARTALSAIHAGALPEQLCLVDEHLAEVAFFEARAPLRDLAEQALAPLDELTPAARERMRETLRAFLDHRGNAPAMAQALHVHPQTARYRLKRLREVFGERLDDPEERFALEVAIRA